MVDGITSTKNAKSNNHSHFTKGPFLWAAHRSLLKNHARYLSVSKIVFEPFLWKAKLSLLERTCKKNKITKSNE